MQQKCVWKKTTPLSGKNYTPSRWRARRTKPSWRPVLESSLESRQEAKQTDRKVKAHPSLLSLLREVPVPPEALAFMRDVLANSTETAEGEGAHATSIGTHNLRMTGDMPIAHPITLSLLALLNSAIEDDAGEIEVVRHHQSGRRVQRHNRGVPLHHATRQVQKSPRHRKEVPHQRERLLQMDQGARGQDPRGTCAEHNERQPLRGNDGATGAARPGRCTRTRATAHQWKG